MTARRLDATVEALVLIGMLMGCVAGAFPARGETSPIAATVTVAAPARSLPGDLEELEIEVNEIGPLPLRSLVGRIAALAEVRASIEERPGRVLGGDAAPPPPLPFGLSMTGTVPAVLDEVARLSGYDWGWEDGRLVFWRYADVEQRPPSRLPGGVSVEVLAVVAGEETPTAPEPAAPVEQGQAAETAPPAASVPEEPEPVGAPAVPEPAAPVAPDPAAPAADARAEKRAASDAAAPVEEQEQPAPAGTMPAEPPPPAWEVDPDAHGTVEDVLRAWAERAGWRLAWRSERRFEVGAEAAFEAGETEEAGFLAAADRLLAIEPMRRTLAATAYSNRWLVVDDVGSAAR